MRETVRGWDWAALSKFKFWVEGSCDEAELPKNSIVFFSKTDFPVKGNSVILPVPEEASELHVMSNKGLLWLPSYRLDSLKVIKISGCESLVYLFQSGAEYNLPNLHTILVENCQRMQALIESKGHSDNVADFKVQPRSEKLKVIRISD
ncbi:hypothetical protein L3X38_021215 [Prunus dulcis]|uniref:Disease resistance protein At4g27190-like leucine-rich repeats domain-containing protein n=1 Tax=Prunus dulcis TaxID=3755 RepID=A0AAD4Z3E9_PRUDU|nr:hypothetical protein L3X38_021215 [Prunus dulcis]